MFGYSKIEALLSRHRYAEAEAAAREALNGDPDDPVLHMFLSIALLNQDKNKAAESAARDMIALDPESEAGFYYLTRTLVEQCRFKEALKAILQAIHLDPADAENWGLKARVLFEMSRNDQALTAAETGLEQDPENESCRFYRSVLLGFSGRHEEADAESLGLLADDPDDAENQCARGWALLAGSDANGAEEHFITALRIDPNSEDAREGLTAALKMRNPIMGALMRSMITMGQFSIWRVIIVVLVVLFLADFLVDQESAALAMVGKGLRMGLFSLFLVWLVIDPLFNLMLLRSRKGRLALSDDQKRSLKWAVGPLLFGGAFLLSWIVRGGPGLPDHAVGAFSVAALCDEIFDGRKPSVRFRMAVVAGASALVVIGMTIMTFGVIRPRMVAATRDLPKEWSQKKIREVPERAKVAIAAAYDLHKWTVRYPALALILLASYRTELREKFESLAPDS